MSDESNLNYLITYMRNKGAFLEKIKPIGRTIVATEDISKNEKIAIINDDLFIKASNVPEFIIKLWLSESEYTKKFVSLLQIKDYDHPVLWDEEDFEKIKGYSKFKCSEHKFIQKKILDYLDDTTIDKNMARIFECHIETRTFNSSKVNRCPKMMVPIVDMLNHSIDPNTYWYVKDEKNLIVNARRDIKQGEEITISYGHLNNIELFSRYGFVIDNNPYKIVIPIHLRTKKTYYLKLNDNTVVPSYGLNCIKRLYKDLGQIEDDPTSVRTHMLYILWKEEKEILEYHINKIEFYKSRVPRISRLIPGKQLKYIDEFTYYSYVSDEKEIYIVKKHNKTGDIDIHLSKGSKNYIDDKFIIKLKQLIDIHFKD